MKETTETISVADWFDITNLEHLKAFRVVQKTGVWPEGFIPANVVCQGMWQILVMSKMAAEFVDLKLAEQAKSDDVMGALMRLVASIKGSADGKNCDPNSDMQRMCAIISRTGQFYDAENAISAAIEKEAKTERYDLKDPIQLEVAMGRIFEVVRARQ